jgi:hypothetical protein
MRAMWLYHITTLLLFNDSFVINLWVLETQYELHGVTSQKTELLVTTAVIARDIGF